MRSGSFSSPWLRFGAVVTALVAVALVYDTRSSDDPDGPDGDASRAEDGITVVVGDIGDGDSFRLGDGERVRMIGIDTPEVDEGDCYAVEARDALRELMPRGSEIRLVFDEARTDRFGRTLAYVYRADDGLFLNAEMVRLGYAEPLVVPPNVAHADQLAELASAARADDAGRWGSCSER